MLVKVAQGLEELENPDPVTSYIRTKLPLVKNEMNTIPSSKAEIKTSFKRETAELQETYQSLRDATSFFQTTKDKEETNM